MTVFLVILGAIIYGGLLLTTAAHPIRSQMSLPELERRAKHSKAYELALRREKAYIPLVTILRTKRALLILLFTICMILGLGWGFGVAAAIIFVLFYPGLARTKLIRRLSQRVYERFEERLLTFSEKGERFFTLLREPALTLAGPPKVDSREELAELIDNSKEALSEEERTLLAAALLFLDLEVGSMMTPRAAIKTVKASEFLGPLVLSELHELGHTKLPVIEKNIDTIVGVLDLTHLLSLDTKKSTTVQTAMDSKVQYIRPTDTAEHALATLLRTRRQLLIVADEDGKTLGLVTLSDLINKLIGRKLREKTTPDDL